MTFPKQYMLFQEPPGGVAKLSQLERRILLRHVRRVAKAFQARKLAASMLFCLCAVLLTACGGGSGGGGGSNDGGGSGPTDGIFSRAVTYTDAGQGDWTGLFATFATGSRYQGLVRASDLGGSGAIRSIAFQHASTNAENTCPNVVIKLAHTTLANLTTTYANNINRGELETVFTSASLDLPAGESDEWFNLSLDTPFYYNGHDNLIVDISTEACAGNTRLKARAASTPYTALIWNISNPAATTGTTWNALASMRFGMWGGTTKVATTSAARSSFAPFDISVAQQNKVQMLYPADRISGSGSIVGVGFPLSAAVTSPQTYTVRVRLAHTDVDALSDTFADNAAGSFTTIADAATLRVPANAPAGEVIWLPINNGYFNYNGSDNLLVEVEVTDVSAATGSTPWRMRGGEPHALSLVGAVGDDMGTPGNNAFDLDLRFRGGKVHVINTGNSSIVVPFAGSPSHKVQFRYDSSQLGVSGQITEIAFRAGQSWVTGSATLDDLQIIIGQNSSATPNTTMADNMEDAVTVFDGQYEIADTVISGDWMVIRLDTPYTIDPNRHLVIQTRMPTAGTGGKTIASGGSPGRFPQYIGGALDADATTITASSSSQASMQLTVR